MVSFNMVFAAVIAITVLSGATAVALVICRPSSEAARKVSERLAQIALLGALAVFGLMGG